MDFIRGKCPECGGELQIPVGHETIICMYCGKKISTVAACNTEGEGIEEAVHPLTEEMYQEAVDDMKKNTAEMLFAIEKPMEAFTKKTYASNFTAYCERFHEVFEKNKDIYSTTDQKEIYLRDVSEGFLALVEEQLNEIPKRRNREDKLLDYNMVMVVFVFPALLEQKNVANEKFAKMLSKCWKEHFPQTNIEPADYTKINAGFKRRFCYITTAVCESQKKPDDCYELEILRDYRDGYLMSRPDGEELVTQYYDVAPTIVKHINGREDSSEIYQNIWEEYLSPCIRLIEEDQNAECMEIYQNMVYDLQHKYFS